MSEGRGLSWPSMAPVCRAVYSSEKAMEVGSAPRARPRFSHASEEGMRSRMPVMSACLSICLVRVLITRDPR